MRSTLKDELRLFKKEIRETLKAAQRLLRIKFLRRLHLNGYLYTLFIEKINEEKFGNNS